MSLGATTSAPASTWLEAVRTSRVVHDLATFENAAMAVTAVLAETHVGHERELRDLGAKRPQGALDDPVGGPRTGPFLVLLFGDPEQQHGTHAERCQARCLPDDLVDGSLCDALEAGYRAHDTLTGAREERHHDVVEGQP
jgi:hypothetical protein